MSTQKHENFCLDRLLFALGMLFKSNLINCNVSRFIAVQRVNLDWCGSSYKNACFRIQMSGTQIWFNFSFKIYGCKGLFSIIAFHPCWRIFISHAIVVGNHCGLSWQKFKSWGKIALDLYSLFMIFSASVCDNIQCWLISLHKKNSIDRVDPKRSKWPIWTKMRIKQAKV